MAKASGGTRKSHPKKTISAEKISAVKDYMNTVDDNGAYTDSDKAKAVYAGREDLKNLYPNEPFITITGLRVDDNGNLHTNIGINGKKIAGMPRTFGQVRFDTSDNKFHINYEGYSWKTATLNNMREQYKYIKDRQNFHKYDDKMENLIDKYNNEPTKEQLAFMSIEQRYRNKK